MTDRDIYLEIIALGNAARVAAIDGATGEEIVFQVPIRTSRQEIEHLALAKMRYRLRKLAEAETGSAGAKKRPGSKPGRGIEV